MPINIFDQLSQLAQERYRAVIIHSTPEKSPALSQFF